MQKVYHWLATAPLSQKLLIVVVLLAAMCGWYYMKPYKAAKDRVEESRKQLNYSRVSLMEAKRRLKEATKAREEMKMMQTRGEDLDKRIPGRVDMSELVGELDQMSDDVKIIEIKPMEDDDASYDSVVIKPINFRVEGRFHSILKFLYKMFKMNRLMDIGDIDLKRKSIADNKKDGAKQMNFDLVGEFTARIYFSPVVMPAAKPGKKPANLLNKGAQRLTMGPMIMMPR
ncbi:MAG: type 4a pilus biogenesis protein PilO [Deltaproteobacteria bacterium]|nr:type 4a pilus biogenesis protein PilO [Deltaproteobacteria bacterium]